MNDHALAYLVLLSGFIFVVCLGGLSATFFHKHKGGKEFQQGDIVTAFGNRGTVKSISDNGMFVIVKFDDFESTVVFNKDGRLMSWHKRPSLRKA